MAEENNNAEDLGLSDDDVENLRTALDDLIEIIVKFKGFEKNTEEDFSKLKSALDFADFIVSGIVYANGLDLCAGHDHDEDEGVE